MAENPNVPFEFKKSRCSQPPFSPAAIPDIINFFALKIAHNTLQNSICEQRD